MPLPEKKYIVLLFFVFFVIAIPKNSRSQIALTAESMALGGGGTAYLTGYESLFINPANLYIQDKNYRFQLSFLQGGVYYDTLLPVSRNIDRYNRFRDNINIFGGHINPEELQDRDYETLLNRNYSGTSTNKEFLTETDLYWFGLKWVRPERSYAVSFRTRYASRYKLGKGLFTTDPVEKKGMMTVNQSFSQKAQVLHEFSFGYAESFIFLNGLLPQLPEFIIGIAPKIVISGASLEANYTNRYRMESGAAAWTQYSGYTQQTSGIFSEYGDRFFNSVSRFWRQPNHSFMDMMRPAGFGAGLDIGITYLITFGDDFSILRLQNEPTKKSLRLSFSITDLGAVYQYDTPLKYSSENIENSASQLSSVSETLFTGAPNEHYFFLSQFNEFSNLPSASQNEETFSLMLPASIQAGALFQYQRLKLVGDFSYSLSESPFSPSGLASYVGIEVRPVSYIPIRGGTRFTQNMTGTYSLGTGVETNVFELNMSVEVKRQNIGLTSEIIGLSVLGLKFYL